MGLNRPSAVKPGILSQEKERVEHPTGIDCVADFLCNRALLMESSSSSFSSFEYSLSQWDYLDLFILRPILAVVFTFSLISLGILFFFPMIILCNSCISNVYFCLGFSILKSDFYFCSIYSILRCIVNWYGCVGWFLAWKLVLVHVPLVQEIFGLRKKPVKPKPPTRRLSKFYDSLNSQTSASGWLVLFVIPAIC